MGIDFFTLAAQIINLIILLFLLRKFLYAPLLKAVEHRQKMIADELYNAEKSRKQAKIAEDKYLHKLNELEKEKQRILTNIHDEAQKIAEQLKINAEKQYHDAQKQWKKRIIAQQNGFDTALQKMAAEQFMRFAEKAIHQIIGIEADDLATSCLMRRIAELSAEQRNNILEVFKNKKTITLCSAHKLSNAKRQSLEKFLRSALPISPNTKFIYANNAELISGITIQADEQMIDWSMQNYLQEFRHHVDQEMSYMLSRSEK